MGKFWGGVYFGLAICLVDNCCSLEERTKAQKRIHKDLTEIAIKAPNSTANIIKNDTFTEWNQEEIYLKTKLDSINKIQDSIKIDSLAKKAYFEGLQKIKK